MRMGLLLIVVVWAAMPMGPLATSANASAVSNKLVVSPSSLTFNATPGQPQPPSQTIHIGSVDPLSVTISEDCSWLAISADSGQTPFEISVLATIATLPVGEYECTVFVHSDEAIEPTVEVKVRAKVNYPFTGLVSFRDFAWQPLSADTTYPHYPAGSDSAYVEVTDPNMDIDGGQIDSAAVVLTSEFGDNETLTLYETDLSSGVFRGRIAFDVQVLKFASWLRAEHPDGLEEVVQSKGSDPLQAEFARWQSQGDNRRFLPGDGLFQISPGDLLTATYNDPLNDWGSPEAVIEQVVYEGLGRTGQRHLDGEW